MGDTKYRLKNFLYCLQRVKFKPTREEASGPSTFSLSQVQVQVQATPRSLFLLRQLFFAYQRRRLCSIHVKLVLHFIPCINSSPCTRFVYHEVCYFDQDRMIKSAAKIYDLE